MTVSLVMPYKRKKKHICERWNTIKRPEEKGRQMSTNSELNKAWQWRIYWLNLPWLQSLKIYKSENSVHKVHT